MREDRDRTPTLSPSPSPKTERARDRLPSPDCEELRRLKKLRAIQELAVEDNEKYVAEPPDRNDFEYDPMTKMWKRKIRDVPKSDLKDKSYDEILKERMEEQFKATNKKDGIKNKDDEASVSKKIDSSKLTLDEIEEIRRKREKFKKEKEKKEREEKEEGEIDDVPEKDTDKKKDRSGRRSPDRSHRSVSRRRSGSRHRDRDRYDRYSSRSDRNGHSRYHDSHNRHRHSRRTRSRSRDRQRTRSRSRDRFRGSKAAIDKEKLLAIAKKNAVKLLSSDNLMGMDHGRLLAIKSGGQSLNQLTDFCRELARKGITDEFSDNENLAQSDDEEVEYHHPFMVKDRPVPTPYSFGRTPGSSLAATGVAIEYLNPEAKIAAKSHRMLEFPVSSGNAHRVKEATIQEKEEIPQETPTPSLPTVVPEPAEVTKESIETPAPTQAELVNKSNPLGVLMFGGVKEPEPEPKPEEPPAQLAIEGPKVAIPDTKENTSVFETVQEPTTDIGSIVSLRLDAMRKLSDNPQNPEALSELYNAQKQMSMWAESKNKPGQFTGHTGAQILSHAELSTGIQAWAKQDQFVKAKKVGDSIKEKISTNFYSFLLGFWGVW